jgi:lipopolysaccharide transport system ATP-binding protein
VSFDAQEGDVLGIIGANGAGKSTLLKILSGITDPTTGEIRVKGRVASLLEVGTGFHPELSGRENVFMNGAILGMTHAEIRRKFDEIVDFAGTGAFVDTPVKRYSSGMLVRLGFAVAAYLEPELLVVDEVLAVGDYTFQKRCLGKMSEVSRSGRTILFVSHNAAAIHQLCTCGLVLTNGNLTFAGDVDECLRLYESATSTSSCPTWNRPDSAPRHALTIDNVRVNVNGIQPCHILNVRLQLTSEEWHRPAFVALDICDSVGVPIMQPIPTLEGFMWPNRVKHDITIVVNLPPLIPGEYKIGVWVGSHNTEPLDSVAACVSFDIDQSPTPGRTYPHSASHGHIVPTSRLLSA